MNAKKIPLLGKGGVDAPIKKMARSFLSGRRRGGSFKQPLIYLTNTTPSAPSKVASQHFFDGAATPLQLRRGLSPAVRKKHVPLANLLAPLRGAGIAISLMLIFAGASQGQELTLDRVISMYIERNLELQAARYRLEGTTADQIAARLRPNPSVAVTAEKFPFSGPIGFSRLYEVGATYFETIELGGKRALRERVANATVSAAEARFADAMRQGVAEVKRLYFQAVLAKRDIAVATENRQMFQQLVQLNLARFQEGAIPEADLIKVRLERVKFDSAVRQAELRLQQSMIRLAENLEDDAIVKQDVAVEPSLRLINPDLQTLLQTALRERPDVQAAEREVGAAGERLALENARAKPDVSPFVGYQRVAADNTLMFGVSVPLKIRDRNQAGIARAEANRKAAMALLEVAKSHTIAEVEAAYEAFRAAREQVQTFRDELLNQADESRSIALAAYEEGATQLLSVLEAQRTRAEVRQQYFRTLFDYEISISELELAVGKEIQ
jgi:cobalt-zinc-cadmium efflux system outer membrane protein